MNTGEPDDAWAEDPANAWGAAPPSWTPPPAPTEPDGWPVRQPPPYPHPVSPFPISPQSGYPRTGYPQPEQPGYGAPRGFGASVAGASGASVPGPPVPGASAPERRDPPYTAHNYAPAVYDPEPSPGAPTRTGVSTWTAPQPPARRITHDEGEVTRRGRRQTYGDEPAYGTVLAFTSGWFGIPTVFYLLWLITLDSERQASVGRSFAASLPWLVAAIVVSLIVATLLRWATVGWRTFALSFASAVIGAGVTTIAHSLTI